MWYKASIIFNNITKIDENEMKKIKKINNFIKLETGYLQRQGYNLYTTSWDLAKIYLIFFYKDKIARLKKMTNYFENKLKETELLMNESKSK